MNTEEKKAVLEAMGYTNESIQGEDGQVRVCWFGPQDSYIGYDIDRVYEHVIQWKEDRDDN
jgi:hypothetical protein